MRAGVQEREGHIQFLSMKITMKYFVPEYQVAGNLMIKLKQIFLGLGRDDNDNDPADFFFRTAGRIKS
jgi:hypothetical protein